MKDFVQNNEQLLAERSKYMEDQAQLMLQMQAEALAKSGIDPVQALQLLNSQQPAQPAAG